MEKILKIVLRLQLSLTFLLAVFLAGIKLVVPDVHLIISENMAIAVIVSGMFILSLIIFLISLSWFWRLMRSKRRVKEGKGDMLYILPKRLLVIFFIMTLIEYAIILFGIYLILEEFVVAPLVKIDELI